MFEFFFNARQDLSIPGKVFYNFGQDFGNIQDFCNTWQDFDYTFLYFDNIRQF